MEVPAVHWFKGVAWNDLALAAVGCLSVTGVWLSFWPSHRERLRKLRVQRLEHLGPTNRQVQQIGTWASGDYNNASHNPQWYNPSWRVNAFDWNVVANFNQAVIEGDFSRRLTEALIGLEESAQRFHGMLANQIEYLSHAPEDIGVRWRPVVDAAAAKGSALTDADMAAIPGLTDLDRQWLPELYRRNRATHVVGIGREGTGALHDAWAAARDALKADRAALQTGRDSGWKWAGHGTAFVFAALGLLFLIDFAWSFVDARRHPTAPHGTASTAHPDSSTAVRAAGRRGPGIAAR